MPRQKINLVGRTLVVISQTPYRLVLEDDNMGMAGDRIVVIDAKSVPDAQGDFGILDIREA